VIRTDDLAALHTHAFQRGKVVGGIDQKLNRARFQIPSRDGLIDDPIPRHKQAAAFKRRVTPRVIDH